MEHNSKRDWQMKEPAAVLGESYGNQVDSFA